MSARATIRTGLRVARFFILELLAYGFFLTLYLYGVLRLLQGRLAAFQDGHRTAYAFISLGLIIAQGVGLEIFTTQLIRRFSAPTR